MRITLVTVYFAPEISPVTHLYADLAEDLVRYGAEVTVVAGMPNRGMSEQERAQYRARTDERTGAGYRILRVGAGTEGRGFLRRGLHLIQSTLALYRAARRMPTDVYLLGSMPPFLGLVGAWLNRNAPTVYVLQDIFPDTLLLMQKFSQGHPLIRLCRWMERASYRGNARLITISDDMAATLAARGVDSKRVTVVPNWADCEAVRPVMRACNPLFDEFNLPRERFTVLYAGTMNVLQCPDTLLDAAKIVQSRAPEILFVLFGGGGLFEHVRQRIDSEGLDNVKLLPLQRQARIGAVYSVGDLALIPLKRGATDAAMPSKTFSAMAASRAVVVTADAASVLAHTVENAHCGYVVPPEDAQALADAVLTAYAHRASLPEMGARARRYVKTELSRGAGTRGYYDVLVQAAQSNGQNEAPHA